MPRRVRFKFTAETVKNDLKASELLRALRAMFDAFGGADVWSVSKIEMNSPPEITAFTDSSSAMKLAESLPRKIESAEAGKPIRAMTAIEQECYRELLRLTTTSVIGAVSIARGSAKKVVVNKGSLDALASASKSPITVPATPLENERGELRGRVEQITARGEDNAKFIIRNRLNGDEVYCLIDENHRQLEGVLGSALRKLVSVHGVFKYNSDGKPIAIRVDRIEVQKPFVMRYADWKPIDVTGGLDSVKYIRKLRDG